MFYKFSFFFSFFGWLINSEFEGNFLEYDFWPPAHPAPSYQFVHGSHMYRMDISHVVAAACTKLIRGGGGSENCILVVKTEYGPQFEILKNFARFFFDL